MKKCTCLFWFLFVTLLKTATAQNADSLFLQAREQAIGKQFETSRQNLLQVLQWAPEYHDAALLYGTTFLWEGQYSLGIHYLDSLQKVHPQWQALFFVRADGRLWGKDYNGLLQILEPGPDFVTDTLLIRWYQAQAHHLLGNYEISRQLTQQLLNAQVNYPNLRALHQENLQQTRSEHIQFDYQFSTFDAPIANWQWFSVEYGKRVGSGPLLIRGTWIDRFNLPSLQGEVEWYPRLNKHTYLYTGVGLGVGPLFPNFRTGAEVFRAMERNIELSGGWRYIRFADSRVHSFTFSASKYHGQYWFSVRPFIIPTAGNVYLTNTFQVRRYFKGSNRWINFTYGIGNSPDMDFRLNSPDAAPSNQLFLLSANLFRLDVQWQFKGPWLIKPFLEYKNEEFIPGNFRTRYTTGSTLLFQF
ncbi:MAG: hypothetical protein C0424_07575 [Sphingobacteriaceae bacterium]|nr:hypothetical protein [Sphingobacteriaceae bacterium]